MRERLRAGPGALLVLLGTLLIMASAHAAPAEQGASRRLLAAAGRGDARGIAASLQEGGDPNARGGAGRPALVAAASSGRPRAVSALLRAGALPDAADGSGWTALHEAAQAGDLTTGRLLLDAGATPDLRSRDRGTALDVAERGGRSELADLLRVRGARGSGKSIGDTVCVRVWKGDGYCGVVLTVDLTRFELRVAEVIGCRRGCPADEACSASRSVGGSGLAPGDILWVPASCLTHTGVR